MRNLNATRTISWHSHITAEELQRSLFRSLNTTHISCSLLYPVSFLFILFKRRFYLPLFYFSYIFLPPLLFLPFSLFIYLDLIILFVSLSIFYLQLFIFNCLLPLFPSMSFLLTHTIFSFHFLLLPPSKISLSRLSLYSFSSIVQLKIILFSTLPTLWLLSLAQTRSFSRKVYLFMAMFTSMHSLLLFFFS